MMKRKTRVGMTMALLLVSSYVLATPGADALNRAANEVKSYFEPAVTLIYVISAVVGLVGIAKTFSKYQSGEPGAMKFGVRWIGGCLFVAVAVYGLKEFFLR